MENTDPVTEWYNTFGDWSVHELGGMMRLIGLVWEMKLGVTSEMLLKILNSNEEVVSFSNDITEAITRGNMDYYAAKRFARENINVYKFIINDIVSSTDDEYMKIAADKRFFLIENFVKNNVDNMFKSSAQTNMVDHR